MNWFAKDSTIPVGGRDFYDNERVDAPIGKKCAHCGRAITEDERGVILPSIVGGPFGLSKDDERIVTHAGHTHLPWHHDCILDNLGIKHLSVPEVYGEPK